MSDLLNQMPSEGDDLELELGGDDPEVWLAKIIEDPTLVQHISRYRTAHGDSLVAFVRCDFAQHQQRYILHLPFYPHFPSIPSVTASIQDDIGGRVRVTDQQKFGTRLEINLDQPLTIARQVLIEISVDATIETNA